MLQVGRRRRRSYQKRTSNTALLWRDLQNFVLFGSFFKFLEMSSEIPAAQESSLPDSNADPDVLLALCCGCVDGASPCIYCSHHKKGEMSIRKFRQVPGKVYGNHTNEEGACSSMLCEATFTTFRIHGPSSSVPLVSLLDPQVDIVCPPAGLKDLCTLSICRRGPGNVNELWYMTLFPQRIFVTSLAGTSPPQQKPMPAIGSPFSKHLAPSMPRPPAHTT